MTYPERENMHPKIRAMTEDNIEKYGVAIMGVGDNPSFSYTIGLVEPFGFEIITVGLPPRIAQIILNDIHKSMKEGLVLELEKIYTPEETPWANLPMKFIKADHPLLFEKYLVQARCWWGRDFPVYQMVFSDRAGLLPGQDGYDHEYMDPRQHLLVVKLRELVSKPAPTEATKK